MILHYWKLFPIIFHLFGFYLAATVLRIGQGHSGSWNVVNPVSSETRPKDISRNLSSIRRTCLWPLDIFLLSSKTKSVDHLEWETRKTWDPIFFSAMEQWVEWWVMWSLRADLSRCNQGLTWSWFYSPVSDHHCLIE